MKRKLVESPSGLGNVYEGATHLGTAHYFLRVYREIHEPHETRDGEIGKVEEVKGWIEVAGLDAMDLVQRSASLTLHLEDGRRMNFLLLDSKGTVGNADGRGLYREEEDS